MSPMQRDLSGGQPSNLISRNVLIVALTAVAAAALYFALPSSMNELARRSATIFLVAAILWTTEALPLFATSLCIIALQILFLAHDGGLAGVIPARSAFPLQPDGAGIAQYDATEFLKSFASPIIILFMGGFLMSSAVTKHGLDKIISARLLRPFVARPVLLIYAILGICAFFSMWMSNTATTAMMLAIIAPIIRNLPRDDRFHRAVVLAVPFGANVGGIGTPIGSPPNAVALGAMRLAGYEVGFLDWMVMAVPLMLIILVVTGLVLLWFFPPSKGLRLPAMQKPPPLTLQGKLTLIIVLLAMVLWITSKWHGVSDAVVALLAAAALTALRVLDRRDVDSIDWNVLLLMWGGLSLGYGMHLTGLVDFVIGLPVIELIQGLPGGLDRIALAGFVVALTLLMSSFMSNTAAAALIVPMAMALSPQDSGALAILTALAASFAMAMPISTPPNAMAFASGTIPATAMIRSGGAISIIAVAVLLLGYQPIMPLFLASAQARPDTRRIAVILPQTGEYAEFGRAQQAGYELAVGDLRGVVHVEYFDSGPYEDRMADLLQEKVASWQPDVIVGPYQSEAALRLPAGEIPVIVPSAADDRITQQPGRRVFRLAPPQQLMAVAAADFIADHRDAWALETLVVLAEASEYGRTGARTIAAMALMRGLPEPSVHFFDEKTLVEAEALAPEAGAMLIVFSRDSNQCVRLMQRLRPGSRVMGFGAAFATPAFRRFLDALEPEHGSAYYVLTPWDLRQDSPVQRGFIDRLGQRGGFLAGDVPSYHSAQAYAALLIAAAALERAEADKLSVADSLAGLKMLTPVGPVQFIDFGGYYRQNPASPVVQRLDAPGAPIVYPPLRDAPASPLAR